MTRARLRLALAALLTLAAAAAGDELPNWPHEQQAMLQQVEAELIDVQRQLFKARQQQDAGATAHASARYRELQDRRRKLIEVTRDQLPSE